MKLYSMFISVLSLFPSPPCSLSFLPFNGLVPSGSENKIDFVCFGLTISFDRDQLQMAACVNCPWEGRSAWCLDTPTDFNFRLLCNRYVLFLCSNLPSTQTEQFWSRWACELDRMNSKQVSQDSTPELSISPSLYSNTDKTQKQVVEETWVLICSHHNDGILSLRFHLHNSEALTATQPWNIYIFLQAFLLDLLT